MLDTSSGTSSTVSSAARRYTMVILAIVYMFNFVDRQILAILLPAIRDEFLVSDTILGLLAGTAFALFYATLGVPIALLADRWNRRNLIAIALAIWSGMTALSGLAANIWQLALARVGVGIGEAGCSPPAHSMISDLYPPKQRSTAMGFYTLGISAGIMLAYLAGGWVVENLGWREAFFIVGLPGLFLAVVVRTTVPEPPRGSSENRADSGDHPPLLSVFRFLLARRSFIHMATAAGLSAFSGYAVISFFPSFIIRSYDMQIVSLGIWLGLILGIAGGAGFFGGGYLADFFARVRQRNAMWFIAITQILAAIASVAVYLAPTAQAALLIFILPVVISNFYLAPVLAQTQSLVPLRMRGVASAIVLLIINLIGLAMGPPLVGALSDYLQPMVGNESLRYSLMISVAIVLPWAALHYTLAGRSIEGDLARARE
ncbi:MAG: MFS transporter [Woeseiaceae bacterium]|nr:MFS transporter [Woeseiaceae bacterium]